MRRIPLHYPLEWPANKQRSADRIFGRYTNNKRDITLAEAQTRLFDALEKFNNQGKGWVVDIDADCLLKTMFDLRKDGGMRSGQRKPPDVGAVCHFAICDGDRVELVLAIDRYTKIEQNIAAIAACVDSLRQLWRVDAGTFLAAASGLNALPPPMAYPNWRTVLGFAQDSTPSFDEVKKNYRVMIKAAHSDNGGNDSVAAEINIAYGQAKEDLSDND